MRRQRVFGNASGITLLKENIATVGKGSTTRIANTYNTGWMNSDIRRTYLSDNVVESVSGPEVGGADLSSGWSSADARWTYSASSVSWAGGGGANSTPSKVYLASDYSNKYVALTFTISGYSGSGDCGIENGILSAVPGIGTSSLVTTPVSANGTYTRYGYWRGGGAVNGRSIQLLGRGTNNFTISDISVKEVVADRSYKAQGASIVGTLVKTQVASAAELVAFSGFSAANYAQEPFSADLDFGTGEWSVGAWVNVPVSLPVENFPVVGSELVTNGDFSNGTTGWLNNNATLSVSSGVLTVTTGPSSTYGYARQEISTVAGKTYSVSIDMPFADNSLIRVGSSIGSGDLYQLFTSTAGTIKFVFTAVGSLSHLRVGDSSATAGAVSRFDNISVRELGPSLIADRAHSSGAKLHLGVNYSGTLTATAFDGTTTRTVTTTAAYNTATWLNAKACYTTDGTLAIRVNGVEVAATRGNPLLTLNNSDAVLTIGNSYALDAPFPGSIALLKLSATVPTPEQSVWMYEQEKQMFRAGAMCCLPDAGSIVDLTYDEATDKWIAASATNRSEFSGLVRTSVTATPAGSYSKLAAAGGVTLQARTTTSPGVDITIPAYGLREELVKRAEAAARLNAQLATFDYVGGFTANTTTGNTAIVSVAGLTYPTSYIGARVSGSGIPANTTIVAVSGTTIYLSAAATATATGVAIAFADFILPVGYEAKEVSLAGAAQREGATQQFTRLFDGFKETIRFGTAPSHTALIQIQAAKGVA
jgi:hypothetical protein